MLFAGSSLLKVNNGRKKGRYLIQRLKIPAIYYLIRHFVSCMRDDDEMMISSCILILPDLRSDIILSRHAIALKGKDGLFSR